MSHIDSGPLATYNSLQDKHLVGFFNNSKMRRHLRKSGLVTRRGEIVTENTYRLTMARKEHQKHVRDLMAQAIVHKALDMERHRQAEIKRKLEEIGKVELVRRVRSQRREGDEDITPYMSPRAPDTRPKSAYTTSRRRRVQSAVSTRPSTAPSKRSSRKSTGVVYLDDDGFPIHRESPKGSQVDEEEIDSQNLRELDPHILDRIALDMRPEDQHQSYSPYSVDLSQEVQPRPPPHRTPRAPGTSRRTPPRGQSTGTRRKIRGGGPKTNKRSLALHRKEPAYPHANQLQSMCDVTVRYRGSNIKLSYEREDKRDEIQVYQQHCGGENLLVFHGLVEAGTDIVFTSRRHRGYPFAATFYINRVEDLRLSTCCEYKYGPRSLLGGKKGHFKFIRTDGATPCYRCAVEAELARRERQRYRGTQTQIPDPEPEPDPELKAQDTQTTPGDVPEEQEKEIGTQADDNDEYQDDFEEEDTKKDDKKDTGDKYSDQFSSESEGEQDKKSKDEEDDYKDDFFEQETQKLSTPKIDVKSASEPEEEIEEETKTTDDVKKEDDDDDDDAPVEEIQDEEKPSEALKDEVKTYNDTNYESSSDSDNDNKVLPSSSSSSSSDSSSSDDEKHNIVLSSELGSSDSEYETRRKGGEKMERKSSGKSESEESDGDSSEAKPEAVSGKVKAASDTKSIQDEDEDVIKTKSSEKVVSLTEKDSPPDVISLERSSTSAKSADEVKHKDSSSDSSKSSDEEKESEKEKDEDPAPIQDKIEDVKVFDDEDVNEDEPVKEDEPSQEVQRSVSPDETKEEVNSDGESRKESVSEAGDATKDVQDKLEDESATQETADGDGDKIDDTEDGRKSSVNSESPINLSTPIITVDKAESIAPDSDQEELEDEVKQAEEKSTEDEQVDEEKHDDAISVKSEDQKDAVVDKVDEVVSAKEADVEQAPTPTTTDDKKDSSSSESAKLDGEDDEEANTVQGSDQEVPRIDDNNASQEKVTDDIEQTNEKQEGSEEVAAASQEKVIDDIEQTVDDEMKGDEDENTDASQEKVTDDVEKTEEEKKNDNPLEDEEKHDSGEEKKVEVDEEDEKKDENLGEEEVEQVEQTEDKDISQMQVEDTDNAKSRSEDDVSHRQEEEVDVNVTERVKEDTKDDEDEAETKPDDAAAADEKDELSSVSSLSSESDSDGEQATTVKILNMSDRKMDSKKARKFARSILKPKYDDVGTLLLNNNPIGDVGITSIVKSLKERIHQGDEDDEDDTTHSLMKITYLNLNNCQLTNKGIIELSEYLKMKTNPLEKLELNGNQIGTVGCKALAAAIRENHTLTMLHIAHSSLGPEGSKTIIDAITDNNAIQELNIEGNDIGEGGGDALLELVKDNSVIQRIKFEKDNYISEKTTKEIKEILDSGSFEVPADEA